MNETQIKQPVVKTNVYRAGMDDADTALDTIVLAFSTDPQLRWFWNESDSYLAYGPGSFEAFGGSAFSSDTVFPIPDEYIHSSLL